MGDFEVMAEAPRAEALAAARRVLAATAAIAEPQHVAALVKQWQLTVDAIEASTVPEVSASDDLAAARKARLSAAKNSVAS